MDEVGPDSHTSEPPREPGPVWPLAPTNSPTPPQYAAACPRSMFMPIGTLSWVVSALLGLSALISAVLLAAEALPAAQFYQVSIGVDISQFLLLLGTGICFLVWTYRLNRNLRVFGVTGLKFTPGWAVGYFFIPVISLWRPYQIFQEIWQASDPGPAPRSGQAWQNLPVPALLGFWWVLWMISNVVDRLAAQSPNDPESEMVSAVFSLVSAILAVAVVRLFTARQERTARLLALLP